MANKTATFNQSAAVTARQAEVPNARWYTGGQWAAACACGLGIGTDNPGLDESLPNWTLLDQAGAARNPQKSQSIGGSGLGDGDQSTANMSITVPTGTEGGQTQTGTPQLLSLANGWVEV